MVAGLTFLALGCGDDPASTSGTGGNVTPDADAVVTGEVSDTAAPDAPMPTDTGCTANLECAGAFDDLGPCEQAACRNGECVREDVAVDTACDDGKPCTTGDRCVQSPSGALVCEPTTPECDDGDVCNGIETCGDDGCVAGTPLACADENVCNGEESCDPVAGCLPGKAVLCADDGDVCNGPEVCEPTTGCVSAGGPSCDDGSSCTTDSCDPAAGCVHAVNPNAAGCCSSDADCDDGNACTAATCQAGTCVVTNTAGPCTTGDPCDQAGVCSDGACVAAAAPSCAVLCSLSGKAGDTVDCPVRLARLAEAEPSAVTLALTIGYQAQVGALTTLLDPFCVTPQACFEAAIPQSTTELKPSGHTVLLQPAAALAWGGVVQAEITHIQAPDAPISGAFVDGGDASGDAALLTLRFRLLADASGSPVVLHSLQAGSGGGGVLAAKLVGNMIVTTATPCGADVCYDGKLCTSDTCTGGSCAYAPMTGACDDGNPCTSGDTCDGSGDCVGGAFVAKGQTCVGRNRCTEVGTCDGDGECDFDPQKAITCPPPGNACVTAACVPATGECVTSAASGGGCSDSNACTTGDACDDSGQCTGMPQGCDDGIPCTTDTCDPQSGCVHTPVDSACDDHNPCTTNVCATLSGCQAIPTTGACNDGDSCTTDDACKAGLCKGTPAPGCGCETDVDCAPLEDGNACNGTLRCGGGSCEVDPSTIVSCPPDGFQCKKSWTCAPATGTCEATEAADCDDGVACTADSCSVTDGCQHVPETGCVTGWICELSGAAGETVDCPIRLARKTLAAPAPTGGDVTLHWDAAKATLEMLVDDLCIGAQCFEYPLVDCATGKCIYQKLQPTGHDLLAVPKDPAAWNGKLAMTTYHSGSPTKPLNDAVVTGPGFTADPVLLVARFKLLAAVPAASPIQVEVSDVHFNPTSGQPLRVTIQVIDKLRTFLVEVP